jgi:hypothetical protein
MSEPMTPDPNEVLTVALTAEQAEHVRERLLADFAEGLEPLARATPAALKDVSSHVASYAAKVESLDETQPVTYADRRCELLQLADDLLALGADRVNGDEAAVRERARRLAPALTGAAILEQFDGSGGT